MYLSSSNSTHDPFFLRWRGKGGGGGVGEPGTGIIYIYIYIYIALVLRGGVCIYIYIFIYLCIYVYMYICIYVSIYEKNILSSSSSYIYNISRIVYMYIIYNMWYNKHAQSFTTWQCLKCLKTLQCFEYLESPFFKALTDWAVLAGLHRAGPDISDISHFSDFPNIYFFMSWKCRKCLKNPRCLNPETLRCLKVLTVLAVLLGLRGAGPDACRYFRLSRNFRSLEC